MATVSSATAVRLRPATMKDEARLFAWRNDPVTREMSFDPNVIPEETHRRWLAALFRTRGERLFIAEYDGDAIGTGRLTAMGKAVVVHVTIAPEQRGKKYAARVITALVEKAMEQGRDRIEAYIKSSNAASLRAFAIAGFAEVRRDGDIVVMERACN